jgi:phospholipase C
VRPSRRLGYRLDVEFHADRHKLHLEFKNHGKLGAHLQARSLTVSGAPYSYTVGAGDKLAPSLRNPGKYDLSLHGPNGFFRKFAGSRATTLRVEVLSDHDGAKLKLRIIDPGKHPRNGSDSTVVNVADAYGPDRQFKLHGSQELTVDTRHSGGWYDIALTAKSDPSFGYELAGRLESGHELTSDPQLGRKHHTARLEHSEHRAKQLA